MAEIETQSTTGVQETIERLNQILGQAFVTNQILVNNLKEALKENERLRVELQQIKLASMPQRGRSKSKTFNGKSIE